MRRHFLALILTFTAGFSAGASAQDSVELPDEYRVIVCNAAVDVDSPLHGLALRVVEKQRFSDPKFDEFIRQTLGSKERERLEVTREIEAVQRLMPFCTIPREEQVRLLLDQIEASNQKTGAAFASRKIDLTNPNHNSAKTVVLAKLLQHHQNELLAELKKRLDVDHPHWILVLAVNLLKIDGHGLLPMLMKAAKSDDVELQYAAIDAINQLRLPQSDADLDRRNGGRIEAVSKTVAKMMSHYDKDGDERLDASEWSKMLQPPDEADIDQDGFVTVEEYGRWLVLRSQRLQ